MEENKTPAPERPRIKVESSQINSIRHDPEASQLEVEFKGGSIYRYDGVGVGIFAEFLEAESKGKYFDVVIKKRPEAFPFTKIRGTDREEAKKNPPV